MKKQGKRTLMPKLRFPEFRDAPGWEEKEVGEVFNVTRGEVLAMPLVKDEQSEQAPYPVYSSQTKNEGLAGYYSEYLYADAITWTTDGANAGNVNYRPGKFFCTNVCGVLISNEGFANACTAAMINSVARQHVSYVGNPKLMNGVIAKIRVAFPSLPEQLRIADCLSSLDTLIVAEGRKLEALRDHKRGLMQQLFPREGETVPRLRFPEFRDKGEWEEHLIEEFFDVGSSKRVLQQDWKMEGVPFYRTRELVSLTKNEPFSSEVFISEELFSELSEKYGVPGGGDFLVSGVGTLGIAYQVRAEDRFYFKDGNVLWLKLTGNLISDFFKYCFQSDFIQNQISGQASASTVGTYTIQNAKKTRILCPVEVTEQQRIADCLSSLDDLIRAQAKKLDALKTHKRGLMQQLFPAPEEQ